MRIATKGEYQEPLATKQESTMILRTSGMCSINTSPVVYELGQIVQLATAHLQLAINTSPVVYELGPEYAKALPSGDAAINTSPVVYELGLAGEYIPAKSLGDQY